MPNNVRFTRYLVPDLREACEWYDNISLHLGQRFREAVNAAFDRLEKSPRAAPCVVLCRNDRFIRVRQFPYLVLFRIKDDVAFVMGVAHTSADLQPWLDRDIG